MAECRKNPPQIIQSGNNLVITWPMVSDSPDFFCFSAEGYKTLNSQEKKNLFNKG